MLQNTVLNNNYNSHGLVAGLKIPKLLNYYPQDLVARLEIRLTRSFSHYTKKARFIKPQGVACWESTEKSTIPNSRQFTRDELRYLKDKIEVSFPINQAILTSWSNLVNGKLSEGRKLTPTQRDKALTKRIDSLDRLVTEGNNCFIAFMKPRYLLWKLKALEQRITDARSAYLDIEEEYVNIMVDIKRFSPNDPHINKFTMDKTIDQYAQTHFTHLMEDKEMMPGILYELDKINLNRANPSEMKDFINLLQTIYNILKTIGFKEGYISSTDFANPVIFPLINTIIPRVLDYNYKVPPGEKGDEKIKKLIEERMENPIKFYNEVVLGKNNCNAHDKERIYNVLITLTVLHLYIMTQVALNIMERNGLVYNILRQEEISTARVLGKLLLGHLGLDIREKLEFKNIKFNKVIHAGYDTEWQGLDTGKNKRLSAQIGASCEFQIEVPKTNSYTPEGIVTNTGEKYIKAVIPGRGIHRAFVISHIASSIDFIRPIIHGDKVGTLSSVNNYLENREGAKYVNSPDKKVYIFGDPKIKTTFIDLAKMDKENTVTVTKSKKSSETVKIQRKEKVWTFASLIDEYIIPTWDIELDMTMTGIIEELRSHFSNSNSNSSIDNVLGTSQKEQLTNIKPQKDYSIEEFVPNVNKKNKNSNYNTVNSYKIKDLRIRVAKSIIIFAHFNAAEISLFDDFEDNKTNFNILRKSFITMGRGKSITGWNVKWRDTILLTSAAKPSLADLGDMHGFPKDRLTQEEKNNMEFLMESNFAKFKEYAVKDAVISLRHGLYILDFVRIHNSGNKVPTTLSSLANETCLIHWRKNNYRGYQLDTDNNNTYDELGNTPKGLNAQGQAGLFMPQFLAASKGGRNEGFMYGVDLVNKWFDWDLNGCYTTIMKGCGNPDYEGTTLLNNKNISNFTSDQLRDSYTVLNVMFKFPTSCKFPCLPTFNDRLTDCYPLEGISNCTGSEYVLAKDLGAVINIINGCMIPWEMKEGKFVNHPFASFVELVQKMRKKYPKGSAMERTWKDIGNMVYGQTCQGIAGKKALDARTGTMQPIPTSSLTNPIISSWICGKARAILGETMNNIHSLGGKIISVTTDGFLTNMDEIETTLVKNSKLNNTNLNWFRACRMDLGHSPDAYELKAAVQGIFTWTTRGQLCVKTLADHKDIMVVAMSGYQKRGKTLGELNNVMNKSLSSVNKEVSFLQSSLRGANDIYKKGGHVSTLVSERRFRTVFDNKRVIIGPSEIKNELNNLVSTLDLNMYKIKENLLSKPNLTVEDFKLELNTEDLKLLELIKEKQTQLQKMEQFLKVDKRGVLYIDYIGGGGLLLDTIPHENAPNCKLNRYVMSRLKSPIYRTNDFSYNVLQKMYLRDEIFVRTLMRDYLDRNGEFTSKRISSTELWKRINDPNLTVADYLDEKGIAFERYETGNKDLTVYKLSSLQFIKFLGEFIKNKKARQRITIKFITRMLDYLMGLKFTGSFIPKTLNIFEQNRNFDIATQIFPSGYLIKERIFIDTNLDNKGQIPIPVKSGGNPPSR